MRKYVKNIFTLPVLLFSLCAGSVGWIVSSKEKKRKYSVEENFSDVDPVKKRVEKKLQLLEHVAKRYNYWEKYDSNNPNFSQEEFEKSAICLKHYVENNFIFEASALYIIRAAYRLQYKTLCKPDISSKMCGFFLQNIKHVEFNKLKQTAFMWNSIKEGLSKFTKMSIELYLNGVVRKISSLNDLLDHKEALECIAQNKFKYDKDLNLLCINGPNADKTFHAQPLYSAITGLPKSREINCDWTEHFNKKTKNKKKQKTSNMIPN